MAEQIKIQVETVDGKLVAFHNKTEFIIQVRASKRRWSKIKTVIGSLKLALGFYQNLTVLPGTEKRLYSPAMQDSVICESLIA